MNDHVLDRLSSANPVRDRATTPDDEVASLVRSVLRVPAKRRKRIPRLVPLTAALVIGLTGAAVGGVGGSILGYAPDSPDDPALTAPRATPSEGQVTPLSQDQAADLERSRQRGMPIMKAGHYFAALPATPDATYHTIYRSENGTVAAYATDREVCVQYRQISSADSTASCLPTALARTRGVYVFAQCIKDAPHPQRRIIAGIAPDGTDVVQGERQGIAQASTPVMNNGFVLVTDQPIDTMIVGSAHNAVGPIIC